jgi:hypothetical protein
MPNYEDVYSKSTYTNVFRDAVDSLIKQYRSPQGASEASKNWVSNMLSEGNPVVGQIGTAQFASGKFYYFNYLPTLLENREVFDSNPIILSLGDAQYNGTLGVNIRFLPFKIRVDFLNEFVNAASSRIDSASSGRQQRIARLQSSLNITWESLGRLRRKYKLEYATRNYLFAGMSNVKVISYENWHRMACIDDDTFVGENSSVIHSKFYGNI